MSLCFSLSSSSASLSLFQLCLSLSSSSYSLPLPALTQLRSLSLADVSIRQLLSLSAYASLSCSAHSAAITLFLSLPARADVSIRHLLSLSAHTARLLSLAAQGTAAFHFNPPPERDAPPPLPLLASHFSPLRRHITEACAAGCISHISPRSSFLPPRPPAHHPAPRPHRAL